MTDTPVVDAHHHFWDPTRRDYYWMGGDELASIRKPIGPEELRPLLVQKQCRPYGDRADGPDG